MPTDAPEPSSASARAGASIAEIQSQQLRAVASRFLWLRPWIVAPGLACAMVLLIDAEVAARQLGVSRVTLIDKLERHGLYRRRL